MAAPHDDGSALSSPAKKHAKLWGGRFSTTTDPVLEKLNASIQLDKLMWKEDIQGSKAYARALEKKGLLTPEECKNITTGLDQVAKEWADEKFVIISTDEDIHTANERRLKEIIGPTAGKLHTGRSRNDQVATDMRLWLKERLKWVKGHVLTLIQVMVEKAESYIDILMPGYTHLQRAQPIRFSHWILSYASMLQRDVGRLMDVMTRVDACPLGSGALAGNPFGIDRQSLAEDLGFSCVTTNSLDGTSDRDFVADYLYWCTMVATHLSKLAEDLIIYCTKEFNFVSLSDAYSTGSSLMPQKKNPDSLELIRGKAGRILGQCFGFMTVLKGLPSTYNKDLQEDKAAMFSCHDDVTATLKIMTGVIDTLNVNEERCRAALSPDMLATDLAYYLVRKGVAFREAHGLAGECVALAEQKQCSLGDLKTQDFQQVSVHFDTSVQDLFSYEASVEQYSTEGGTAKTSVQKQISDLKNWLETV